MCASQESDSIHPYVECASIPLYSNCRQWLCSLTGNPSCDSAPSPLRRLCGEPSSSLAARTPGCFGGKVQETALTMSIKCSPKNGYLTRKLSRSMRSLAPCPKSIPKAARLGRESVLPLKRQAVRSLPKVKATLHLSVEASQRLSVHATMLGVDRSELVEQLIRENLKRFVVSDRGGSDSASEMGSPESRMRQSGEYAS